MKFSFLDGTAGSGEFTPQHRIARVFEKCGVEPVSRTRPFVWDGDLDGLFGTSLRWLIAGRACYDYHVPVLCPQCAIPGEELILFTFSHGIEPALHACNMGLKARILAVNPPIRNEMINVAKSARQNIIRWVTLYGDYRDWWAVFGGIGDGHLSLIPRRKFPEGLCDYQELVPGGHGDALRLPRWEKNWPGWIEEVSK